MDLHEISINAVVVIPYRTFKDKIRTVKREIENQIDKLSKSSWYSKIRIKRIIRDELERFEKLGSD